VSCGARISPARRGQLDVHARAAAPPRLHLDPPLPAAASVVRAQAEPPPRSGPQVRQLAVCRGQAGAVGRLREVAQRRLHQPALLRLGDRRGQEEKALHADQREHRAAVRRGQLPHTRPRGGPRRTGLRLRLRLRLRTALRRLHRTEVDHVGQVRVVRDELPARAAMGDETQAAQAGEKEVTRGRSRNARHRDAEHTGVPGRLPREIDDPKARVS
jgi:hypothetical protein